LGAEVRPGGVGVAPARQREFGSAVRAGGRRAIVIGPGRGTPAEREIADMASGLEESAAGPCAQLAREGDGGGATDGLLLESFLAPPRGAAFRALVERHGPMSWRVPARAPQRPRREDFAFQPPSSCWRAKAASVRRGRSWANWPVRRGLPDGQKARVARGARQTRSSGGRTKGNGDVRAGPHRGRSLARLQPCSTRSCSSCRNKYRVAVVLATWRASRAKDGPGNWAWPRAPCRAAGAGPEAAGEA